LPQEPQLESLVCVETHAPPHAVSPKAHVNTHLPREQSDGLVHGMPHTPQLFPSTMRSVHMPPHSVCPARHTHFPPWQTISPLHSTPQAPQF
jgi:hypothetical protein